MVNIGSKIHGAITNATSGFLGRAFDIIFTDKGLLFAKVGGFSLTEAVIPVLYTKRLYGGETRAIKKKRGEYQKLSLEKILESDKKNYFISYDSIEKVWLRKSLVNCGFEVKVKDERMRKSYTFAKKQYDEAQRLVEAFLSDKLRKGWF